jgi:hypothetical protein
MCAHTKHTRLDFADVGKICAPAHGIRPEVSPIHPQFILEGYAEDFTGPALSPETAFPVPGRTYGPIHPRFIGVGYGVGFAARHLGQVLSLPGAGPELCAEDTFTTRAGKIAIKEHVGYVGPRRPGGKGRLC